MSAAALALLLAAPALAAPAAAGEASPWDRAAQSQARLIAGGVTSTGDFQQAGLEVRLRPGFITYWRDPGDAGVPPTFSFAGSNNLRDARVLYPAPWRLDEAGAVAFGYEGDVVFPILVSPADPSKPVDLAVRLDYAVCHDLCLPAHADLRLTLDGSPSPEADRVRDAFGAVPRPGRVGEARTPAVLAVTPPTADGGFTVLAALPDGAGALFVEAPEGWAYAAGAAEPAGPGRAVFAVKRLQAPEGRPRPPGRLALTLTSAAGAVAVEASLDGAPPKP